MEAEPKIVQEIMKSHDELIKRVERHMEIARSQQQLPPEEILKEKDELLERLKGQVSSAERAKEAALRRFDREIAQNREAIARVTDEIKELRRTVRADSTRAARLEGKKAKGGKPRKRMG